MRTRIFIIFILVSNLIFAQNQDTIKLQEVVIESDVVDYKIYKNKNTTSSLVQLIEQLPGVTITKRSNFSIEPSINSFKYEQINTTINGGVTASSSCPNRMDPIITRISSNEIKKIEIVRGPFEVRYGQIMGGYINFVTQENPNYEKFSFGGGNIASEYNFNGNGAVVSANIKAGNKFFDIDLGANKTKFDNYVSGSGQEISSSFETYGFNTNIGANLSKKQRLIFAYVYSKADDIMHAGLPMDAKYDESNMFSLDYNFNDLGKLFTDLKVKMYASVEDHLMTNEYRPNASASLANTPVNSHNYGGRFEFTLKPFTNAKMHIGTDFKQIAKDGMKEVTIYKNVCTTPPTVFPTPVKKEFEVWQNSYSQDFGVFVDLQYMPNEKLKLKTGLRSDFIKSDIKDAEEDFKALYNNDITPDDILNLNYYAQAKYALPKNYSIEISAGHGTRNPSLLERYINHFTVGLDAYEYVGNPHLKSETNNQINLMLSQKNKFTFVYLNTFYSRINNYITAVEDTTIARKFTACKEPKYAKRFVNIDNAEQYGINFGGNVKVFKDFLVNVDLTYTYAQNLDLNEALPEIAPFTSLVSIIYKHKNLNLEFQNEYQAEQKRVSSLVGESETPAFSIINIKLSYLFYKKLNLGFAVDNISNENYYRHLSRPYKNMDTQSMFYEPGRNFKIFVKYNF